MARRHLAGVFLLSLAVGFLPGAVRAEAPDYHLAPEAVADGVYVLWGAQDALTPENGGAIANSGFIVGDEAVLAIDPGPTALFAQQLLDTIRGVTELPVKEAVVTHHHPDHAFGIEATVEAGIPVLMHPAAAKLLAREGETLLGFMTELVGEAWTAGTRIGAPTLAVETPQTIDLGGRAITVTPMTGGHTPGDLIVFDEKTRTLFAGDLVFIGRAATVPHADIPTWRAHVAALKAMNWRELVPGHGPLVNDPAMLDTLDAYLAYLDDFARAAWNRGDSPAEALMEPLPERFRGLAQVDVEFQRSLLSLFERFETHPPEPR